MASSTNGVERVLQQDQDGTDTIIDDKHNVNYLPEDREVNWPPTHTTRDGAPMVVLFHPSFRCYYVEVSA